jgi:biopolymer transport protein ExbD
MRLRNRHNRNTLPEVNLIPMMDVLMTVLTFFIIVSMSLSGQQLFNLKLPTATRESQAEKASQVKLTVGLDAQGNMSLDGQAVANSELPQNVQTFLRQHPKGTIVLKADRTLEYTRVAQVLKTLRDLGGDRISLAIETGK